MARNQATTEQIIAHKAAVKLVLQPIFTPDSTIYALIVRRAEGTSWFNVFGIVQNDGKHEIDNVTRLVACLCGFTMSKDGDTFRLRGGDINDIRYWIAKELGIDEKSLQTKML